MCIRDSSYGVSDGEYTESDSFTLTVNPINDAPVIVSLSNQTIDEDSSLTVELSASDVDGDDLSFSSSSGVVDGTTLTITPPENYNGSEDVTVIVSDGQIEPTATFTLTINPVNDAPTFITSSLGDVDEDVAYSFTLDVDDIDNLDDELSVSISSGPSWPVSYTHLTLPTTPYV